MLLNYLRIAAALIFATVMLMEEGLLAGEETKAAGTAEAIVALTPNKKYWISGTHYFTCAFDKKPQIGTAILKVQIFTKSGDRDTSFLLQGEADMPGMRGAHRSGLQPFTLNNKGDYLLPVSVVMPGEWEVLVRFSKDNQVLFIGRLIFHV